MDDGLKELLMEKVKRLFAGRGLILTRYAGAHRSAWMQSISRIKDEREFLLNYSEACQIISAVTATARIPGDLAEVGVAYGASAKLILEYSKNKTLHLFDTFAGLPAPDGSDSAKFQGGDFRSDVHSVRDYLGTSSASRVAFHVGLFPATTAPVENTTFSFVHLDVDLYQSTLDGLRFFYPRLSPGGILISHDYVSADGVNRAFQEFFADKPEPVIEVTGYQCMVVKLGTS
jgi:hypothetical protein